jgi:hypothetical protein
MIELPSDAALGSISTPLALAEGVTVRVGLDWTADVGVYDRIAREGIERRLPRGRMRRGRRNQNRWGAGAVIVTEPSPLCVAVARDLPYLALTGCAARWNCACWRL